jgi:hypothetical protein
MIADDDNLIADMTWNDSVSVPARAIVISIYSLGGKLGAAYQIGRTFSTTSFVMVRSPSLSPEQYLTPL